MQKHLLLDAETIQRKLARMAYQIWERHSGEQSIYLLSVEQGGRAVAEALAAELRRFSPLAIAILPLKVDKKNALSPASLPENTSLDGQVAVLVDDVANSGKTLFYALRPLLDYNLKALSIAVLVDRLHKTFPITPDIVGQAVATTLKDHIEVESQNGIPVAAYLI